MTGWQKFELTCGLSTPDWLWPGKFIGSGLKSACVRARVSVSGLSVALSWP
jgi:hypothetical protein